jgi:hypothetical protein
MTIQAVVDRHGKMPHEFRKSKPMGRPKGSQGKSTKLIREAILLAAECEGSDGKGKEGLLGYCRMLAREHPPVFTNLLAKMIPLQVQGNIVHEVKTHNDVIVELQKRGLPSQSIFDAPIPQLEDQSNIVDVTCEQVRDGEHVKEEL